MLIDFWAPWCGPCRLIGPVVEEIATQYAGRLTVGKLNVDEHPTVAQRYGITSIPALMFFHDGQVRETVVGAVPKPVLTARVDEVLRRIVVRGPARRVGEDLPDVSAGVEGVSHNERSCTDATYTTIGVVQ